MINSDSRYLNASVSTVDHGGEKRIVVSSTPETVGVYRFSSYQVRDGDTVDFIAARLFGDGSLWWRIANLNPEILWWDSLAPGTTIRVPA